jgi:hypothetical protein
MANDLITPTAQTKQGGEALVHQLLGQAQAFQAAGNLLQTFGVSKLALVKENKLYQTLKGYVTPNGLELSGTWVEFCDLLGVSDEKANNDIANLQAFGEAALAQMQLAGVGYRELRQYRKLPDDERLALTQAAADGDKDVFLELAETLIEKHALEKVAADKLQKELKSDRANALAARDKAEADATHAAEQLQTAMNRKPSKGEKPYLVQDITAELAVYVRKAQIAIQGLNEQLVAIKESGAALDGYRDSLGSLGYASIANVFMQAASLAGWAKNEGFDQSDYSRLDLRSVHDDKQLAAARDAYVSLARLEEAETHNRKVDRQAARPKGKGAPLKTMPIAADDAALSD